MSQSYNNSSSLKYFITLLNCNGKIKDCLNILI